MPPARILIVEDEAIAAENIAGRLRQQGYDVVGIIDSGVEAIAKAGTLVPDLILMDIMLKGEMDGVAAATEISERWQIPVVFMTAFGDENTLQRAKAAAPFGYLIKPFKANELRATVEVALSKHEADLRLRVALEKEEQLRRQAESLHSLKSEFLSALSHEFRTPLSSIYLSTDLLENQSQVLSDEKKNKRYSHIRTAISHMTKLLDDITSIGKSELEKLQSNPTSFSLEDFCRSLIEEFQQEYDDRYILNFFNHSNHTDAYLDEKLLHHILHNLLSNAIKYSPQGGIVNLNLECIRQKELQNRDSYSTLVGDRELLHNSGVAIFSVRDWGIGIPTNAQVKLFDAFFRAENVGEIPGDGLGLAIVKNYVDILGGDIAVESELGLGSTFTVKLPLGSS